jgi:hypothetical protein
VGEPDGDGVADEVGVAVGVGLGLGVGDGDGVRVGDGVGVGVALADGVVEDERDGVALGAGEELPWAGPTRFGVWTA